MPKTIQRYIYTDLFWGKNMDFAEGELFIPFCPILIRFKAIYHLKTALDFWPRDFVKMHDFCIFQIFNSYLKQLHLHGVLLCVTVVKSATVDPAGALDGGRSRSPMNLHDVRNRLASFETAGGCKVRSRRYTPTKPRRCRERAGVRRAGAQMPQRVRNGRPGPHRGQKSDALRAHVPSQRFTPGDGVAVAKPPRMWNGESSPRGAAGRLFIPPPPKDTWPAHQHKQTARESCH